MELIARLENIEFYVKQLKAKHDVLQGENEKLKEKNKNLEDLVNSKKHEIVNLEVTNKNSKLAGSVPPTQDNSELKHQIDLIIKEVDNCLTLVKK